MAFFSMAILAAFFWVFIGLVILLLIGTIILQIFLSKMKNPWAGLILPGFIFCVILLLCTMTPDLYTFLLLFGKGNIPTVLYLIIYFFFRIKKKKSDSASHGKETKE